MVLIISHLFAWWQRINSITRLEMFYSISYVSCCCFHNTIRVVNCKHHVLNNYRPNIIIFSLLWENVQFVNSSSRGSQNFVSSIQFVHWFVKDGRGEVLCPFLLARHRPIAIKHCDYNCGWPVYCHAHFAVLAIAMRSYLSQYVTINEC